MKVLHIFFLNNKADPSADKKILLFCFVFLSDAETLLRLIRPVTTLVSNPPYLFSEDMASLEPEILRWLKMQSVILILYILNLMFNIKKSFIQLDSQKLLLNAECTNL